MQRIATTLIIHLLDLWMYRSQTQTGKHDRLNFAGPGANCKTNPLFSSCILRSLYSLGSKI